MNKQITTIEKRLENLFLAHTEVLEKVMRLRHSPPDDVAEWMMGQYDGWFTKALGRVVDALQWKLDKLARLKLTRHADCNIWLASIETGRPYPAKGYEEYQVAYGKTAAVAARALWVVALEKACKEKDTVIIDALLGEEDE